MDGRCARVVPEVAWARSLGSFTGNVPPLLAVDAAGNVYAAGLHSSIADIDLGDGTVARWPGESAVHFVISYDPNGRARWLRLMTPPFPNANIGHLRDLAVGPGCVALAATFVHYIDLGAGILTSEGEGDAFVLCLDPATGETRWNAQVASESGLHVWATAVGAAGHVAIAGVYRESPVRIGDDVHPPPSTAYASYFAVFDTGGALLWSSIMEGVHATRVAAGPHRDFLFATTADGEFDPRGTLIDFAADDGRELWEQRFLSAVAPPVVSGVRLETLVLGPAGTFLLGGGAAGVSLGSFELRPAEDGYDEPGFIAQVGADGTPIEVTTVDWAPTGFGIQGDGSRVLGGSFHRDADFGGCTMTEDARGPSRRDGFVVSLDERGRCEWALHLTSYFWDDVGWGHFNKDLVTDLELDPTGAPIFTGVFNETLQIGATTLTGVHNGIYVAKLRVD